MGKYSKYKWLDQWLEDGLINQEFYEEMQKWKPQKIVDFLNFLIKDGAIEGYDQEGNSIKEIDPNEVESALHGRYYGKWMPETVDWTSYGTGEASIDYYIEHYEPTELTEIEQLPDGTYGEVTKYHWELAPQYQEEEVDEVDEVDEAITQTGEITTGIETQEEMDAEEREAYFEGLSTEERDYILGQAHPDALSGDDYLYYRDLVLGENKTGKNLYKGSKLSPADAFLRATGEAHTGFITEDGKVVYDEFGVPLPLGLQPESMFHTGFMNEIKRLNEEQVFSLQDLLVSKGIADEDDFDDSGTVDSVMENYVNQLMLTAQQRYSHISYQSEEWQAIADGVPDAFIWAQDDKSEDIRFSWGLLGKMLDDWSIHESTLLDKEVDEYVKDVKKEKPVPGIATMTAYLNEYFETEVDRLPTQQEINEYIKAWTGSHDTFYQEMGQAYRAAEAGSHFERYLMDSPGSFVGQAITSQEEQDLRDDIQAGGDVLTGLVGTRPDIATVDDPQNLLLARLQEDLRGEKDYIKEMKVKRNNQVQMLGIMTGRI